MRVVRLTIENFRGIKSATLHFNGHTLLVGGNNVGKSTICEALDLALGPDRFNRPSPVEEYDFRNANYLAPDGKAAVPIRVEIVLADLTEEIRNLCAANIEFWHAGEQRLLGEGEIDKADIAGVERCLRLIAHAAYEIDEDRFAAKTCYARSDAISIEEQKPVPSRVKRAIGFLYLRALRTGSRALSLERGTLLDNILRMKEMRDGMWEGIRTRLAKLDPPIDADASELGPVLDEIEARLADYIAPGTEGRSTRLFVSQLTREHLRKTISFFLTMGPGESSVPFQFAGTGTLNTLVLALLTFIADIKKDNVIFAMEEPEIALPPHTQRRIAGYLLAETSQCFVTSHSPYVIECFEPTAILKLYRDKDGVLSGTAISLPPEMKVKNYRQNFRRLLAEAMLGRGVIVGEGLTEQELLLATAQKMEESDPTLFALDVAGVCVVNAEGDGNLEKLGQFFKTIGVPSFAFFDKKKRTPEQLADLEQAYAISRVIDYKGAEQLLAAEVPLDRQWEFLEATRKIEGHEDWGIPATRPSDDTSLRALTTSVLKGMKGDGGAALLVERCKVAELPVSVTKFLSEVYVRYPKPKKRTANTSEGPAKEAAAAANPTA